MMHHRRSSTRAPRRPAEYSNLYNDDHRGDCAERPCANGVWSAATAAESCFANCDYYSQMKDHGGTEPPAAACPGDSVCECPDKAE